MYGQDRLHFRLQKLVKDLSLVRKPNNEIFLFKSNRIYYLWTFILMKKLSWKKNMSWVKILHMCLNQWTLKDKYVNDKKID